MSTARSNLPTVAELRATVDETGVVNLAKLCDLCLESLRAIHANAYGAGNESRSRAGLAKRVALHLTAHGFPANFANYWFHDHPRVIFALELNAEGNE